MRNGIKDDNKGSSFLLVIITMSFIAVIAAVIIAVTYRNLESVRADLQSDASFYTAESLTDEFRATLGEWSDDVMKESYTRWLQCMSVMSDGDREKRFKQMFVEGMESRLSMYFGASPSNDIQAEVLDNYKHEVILKSKEQIAIDTGDAGGDKTSIALRNVTLGYKDDRGYSTSITSDYAFNINYPGLGLSSKVGVNAFCTDYVIIADGQINNIENGNVNIDGSIYGGGCSHGDDGSEQGYVPGILFKGGKERIYADKILSREDIEVCNGAELTAKGLDAVLDYTGDIHYCDMWVKGISLIGNSASVNIQGNCYVNDDMTLSPAEAVTPAPDSTKKLSVKINGNYYGYNYNTGKEGTDDIEYKFGTPEGSSSIVINSDTARVDLMDCRNIWLAGKAFISVPNEDKDDSTVVTDTGYVEGESLSYRGIQSAYLVPGECITGIGHNPMDASEYQKILDDESKAPGDRSYEVDVDGAAGNGGIKLSNYVDAAKPYRVAYVTHIDKKTLVYLFLNFKDAKKAAEYFQEYEVKYPDYVDARMGMFGDGRILFKPDSVTSTGNCIGYDDEGVVLVNANREADDMKDKQIELSTSYSGLMTALYENYASLVLPTHLTDGIVDMTLVGDDDISIGSHGDLNTLAGAGDAVEDLGTIQGIYEDFYLVTGKNITVNTNMSGIIIAKGDVNIAGGARFNGLIVARGNVIVNGTYKAEPDGVEYLIYNNDKVSPYFWAGSINGGINGMQAPDIVNVSCENWRKN